MLVSDANIKRRQHRCGFGVAGQASSGNVWTDLKKWLRAIELENGLKVLLIHKPTAYGEKVPAAASMVVEAGFFHEPRQGSLTLSILMLYLL